MEAESVNIAIGNKIRNLRMQNGLTQQELADRAELTKGFISQLERGQVSPSITTLLDLIECLGTTPSDFFRQEGSEQVVFSESDWFEKDGNGFLQQWIVPSAQGKQMESLHVTVHAGIALPKDAPHTGEEFGYVLSGKLIIHIGDVIYEARKGDGFYYASDREHWIENPFSQEARFIWISSPPSF
jgi:transcriptional regulator with XRE-family HTH domain